MTAFHGYLSDTQSRANAVPLPSHPELTALEDRSVFLAAGEAVRAAVRGQCLEPRREIGDRLAAKLVMGGQREPAVAGSFYPGDAVELEQLVSTLVEPSAERGTGRLGSWHAAMAPHAGLQYSGAVAAATFGRVAFPESVIVLAPKHTRLGAPWAVAPHDRWPLPGGAVDCDPQLAARLAESIAGLELDAVAHCREHAIEVQLPLIARLAPKTKLVGVVIGGGTLEDCFQFADQLAEVVRDLRPRPLLVISSDMNHFAEDSENRRLDDLALTAAESLDPALLYQTVRENSISMCGLLPAVIVMQTLRQLNCLNRVERAAYGTSADVTGDTSRVVGYAGLLFG